MKNLFIIGVILIFATLGCGDPQNVPVPEDNANPNNCVSLAGGLASDIPSAWEVDANSTAYRKGIFTITTDTKGYGDGLCAGKGPCYDPYVEQYTGYEALWEARWSVSGNTITLTDGKWRPNDDGQLKYYVYNSAIYYWEIKSDTHNTMTLEYFDKQYNKCDTPYNSTRQ